jgi:hypothetical protein
MEGVYVVLGIVSSILDVKVCEVYTDKDAAFKSAIALAEEVCPPHRTDWLDRNPQEEKSERLSRWVFLDTSAKAVMVTFQKIIESPAGVNDLRSVPDDPISLPDPVIQVIPTSKDDAEDRSLPGGWYFNNKPAIFGELLDDPFSIRTSFDMTEDQRWALVIARIRKRPNFSMFVPGKGTFTVNSALIELKNKSSIGLMIRDLELDWLDSVREESIMKQNS